MADRLVIGDRGTADLQGSGAGLHGASLSTGRTGLRLAEFLALLAQRGFQGALGESAGGVDGGLLQGVEIGVEVGAVVAEGMAGDDFSPAVGQVVEFGVVGRSSLPKGHGKSHLELGKNENLGNSA